MRSRILFIPPCIGLLVFGLFYSGTGNSTPPQTPDNRPSVINKTRSFEVLTAERGPKELNLTFRNNYPKRVTAFQIAVGNNFIITEELIFSELPDIGIKPQEIVAKTYPLPLSIEQVPSVNVTVKAIVLDDGTGDGDVLAYEDIKAARLGEKIQLRRTVKKLHEFLNGGKSDVVHLKNEVKSTLNASETDTLKELLEIERTGVINRDSDAPLSDNLKQGLENGRQNALRRISELENANPSREGVLKLKATYENMLTRL